MLLEHPLVHGGEVITVDRDPAPGGTVDAAEQVQQRRFAASAGAHDGDRAPFVDLPVRVTQRVDLFRPHLIALTEPADCDANAGMLEE